jgi:mono/diheme cytochrome c family protein
MDSTGADRSPNIPGNNFIGRASYPYAETYHMKSPWAQLTVALVTICSGAAFLAQADAQNVAPEPGAAHAQAADAQNPVATSEVSIAEGKGLYRQHCVLCHGDAGKGDGSKAESLKVRPANLSVPKMWRRKDGAIYLTIIEGKEPMPSFRSQFSTNEAWALVNYVRTLAPQVAGSPSAAADLPRSPTAPEPGKRQAAEKHPGADKDAGLPQPEYFHVLINPLPIYGLAAGALVLAGALILRNRPAQLLALAMVFLCAASAWPTYVAGEKAYYRVYPTADREGQQWLDAHKRRGEKLIYVFYALAAVALSAALIPAKAPKTAFPLASLTLIMALTSLAAGGWIGKAGGKIRHPEFRHEPPPQPPPHRAADKQNPVAASEASIAVGKALYQPNCVSCHGEAGEGDGPKSDTLDAIPPDLSNPDMWRQKDGALYSKIIEGKEPMPSFRSKFSTHQVWALVNYVRALAPQVADGSSAASKPQGAEAQSQAGSSDANLTHKSPAWTASARVARWKNPLATNENSIAEGKTLYEQECLICHGPEGKGDGRVARILDVKPADLSDTNIWQQTDGALCWKISEGKVPMPAFRMRFSRHEVWLLVNYVRTLAPRETVGHPLEPNREPAKQP